MKSAIDALNSFMGAFSLIMGAVASISLLVGGIGIMNMMLTNVTERIREIGIRRAIGAQRSSIVTQFLIEAGMLCGMGGIVGIIFGTVRHRWPIGCPDRLSAGLGPRDVCLQIRDSWRARSQRANHTEFFNRHGAAGLRRLRRHRRNLWLLPRSPRGKAQPGGVPALPVSHHQQVAVN